MDKNPVRMAWAVLLSSFIICCLLAVSIPLGVRWRLLHAEASRTATLRTTAGTVLVVTEEGEEPIAVVDTRAVESGALIQTDQTSRATLVFPAGEEEANGPDLATVQVYANAQVRLERFSRPRYPLSRDADRITLEIMSGRVRVNTAELLPRGLRTEIKTPQAMVHLGWGSYAIEVNNAQTLVAARIGEAKVDAAGVRVVVDSGMRSTILTGQPPESPAPTAESLIVGGDFSEPLGPPNWLISRYPEEDPSAGSAEVVTTGGRRAVRFSRVNQPATHTEVAITQVLDRNVRDYEQLNLQMDVQLRWQSLGGAGEQSSEFPLMLWLDYQDIYGNHQFWTHGFYYRDPPPQWVVTGGEKIPASIWFPFESGNLLERLPMEGRPPPAHINWITIYASGHNYESLVTEVRLVGR